MTDQAGAEARQFRADRLRERIYLAFTALAVVLALTSRHVEAPQALATLSITVLGTLSAILVADVVSHLVVQERPMSRAELRHAVGASFGALSGVGLPILFLVIAWVFSLPADTALRASAIGLIVALVVIGYVAIRRIRLRWWQRLVALGAEAAIGLVVVGLQVLAHGA